MELNQKTERKQFPRKVGLAEFRVLKFNPTRSELNKILGRESREDDKEIEYDYHNSRTGMAGIRIKPVLQDVKTGYITNDLTFFLENTVDKTQDGVKTWYVNAVGDSRCSETEHTLSEWFKKAMTYREAKSGEKDLMKFVRRWITNIELNVEKGGSKNNILLNVERLFKGDVTELNDLVNSEFAGTITCQLYVTTRKDDETKFEQGVFNKDFLNGYCIQYFRHDNKKEVPNFVKEFMENMKGQYGPKGFSVLAEMRDYKPGEDPVASNEALLPFSD